ncbi:MAG TPA: DNA-processing protein DprA [Candidatus Eisenbacteria bacterium]|nr:DNA-processing protein DprA [Candidatus Eisenbacteria bacterium]
MDGKRTNDLAPRAVAPEDPEYPHGLERLSGTRPVVFLRGGWERTGWRVAIVGSRRASDEGGAIAFELAAALADRGIEILSGLARGIDAAAHRGALSASGRTGAVLGTGFDLCYPDDHRELSEAIAASVGLLTERPAGSPVTRSAFASRNRLLAALSDAVVVVEGGARSGALLTARHARSMRRPVGAVPWSLWNPHGAAPHALLRGSGASLVTGPGDVLALLPGRGAWPQPELPLELAPLRAGIARRSRPPGAWVTAAPSHAPPGVAAGSIEARILAAVRERPETVDEVAARAGATIQEASAALLLLEMSGSVRREFGGRVRLVPRLRFRRAGA